MIPSKITLQGNYWDCQIYRGRLYLFTIDGSIKTIDWNKLINSFKLEEFTNVALSYAYQNGRDLYHPEMNALLTDPDIRALLRDKFIALSNRQLNLTEAQLELFVISEQDTPFKELHTDSEVSSNKLYALTHNSFESLDINATSKKYPVASVTEKHYDIYGFTLRANNYAKIAISAGDDGLMEYNGADSAPYGYHSDERMTHISSRHSSFADYNFLSIYNSSLAGDSAMSYFVWKEDKKGNQLKEKPERIQKDDITESTIFEKSLNSSYLSWGSNEKIYRAVQGGIEMVRFNNYAKSGQPIFSNLKFLPIQNWKGKILSASVAYFGTVLHCENAVVVMLSDSTYYNIPGEISRIRTYPRSLNYENHLHVIHDEKLELYSFNNDYFIDQKNKDFGFAYRQPKNYGFSRRHFGSNQADSDNYKFEDPENDNKGNIPNKDFDIDLPF